MITLTESAVKKVQEFFHADPEAKGKSLRIGVVSGGCSGYQYAFGFDSKKSDDSEIFCDGFTVLVDPQSSKFLENAKIDFVDETTGSGFKIENPNVKKTCGCGQSNSF